MNYQVHEAAIFDKGAEIQAVLNKSMCVMETEVSKFKKDGRIELIPLGG